MKSYQCFGAVINAIDDKIVGFNVIQNKEIPPQRLESEILQNFKYIYQDNRVIGHIQDGDLGNINLVHDFKKSLKIYLDANHIQGQFSRILDSFNKKGDQCFNPFKKKLLSFFKMLLYNKVLNINQKKFQWSNVLNHFMGIHGFCLHSLSDISDCIDPIHFKHDKKKHLFN